MNEGMLAALRPLSNAFICASVVEMVEVCHGKTPGRLTNPPPPTCNLLI